MSDRGLPRRRSLRNRLALGFFAVTALALAAAMFVFLPQLATKIENQKLDDLQQVAEASAPRLDRVIGRDVTGPQIDALVRTLSDRTSARVTLLGLQQSSGPFLPQFYVITDSNQTSNGTPNYALARNQGLELPLELGELLRVAPDAAAELVERVLEPFALGGDEVLEAVALGFELTDSLLEPFCVALGHVRLA